MLPYWRRHWQPTPVFLPGESQGQRSLVGCCLWGRTESDTTEATLAAAAAAAAAFPVISVRVQSGDQVYTHLNGRNLYKEFLS